MENNRKTKSEKKLYSKIKKKKKLIRKKIG